MFGLQYEFPGISSRPIPINIQLLYERIVLIYRTISNYKVERIPTIICRVGLIIYLVYFFAKNIGVDAYRIRSMIKQALGNVGFLCETDQLVKKSNKFKHVLNHESFFEKNVNDFDS